MNQSLLSLVQSERKRFDVQAKVAISEGVKKERIQSWTSSGKSENETEVTASVVRFDMIFLDLKNKDGKEGVFGVSCLVDSFKGRMILY